MPPSSPPAAASDETVLGAGTGNGYCPNELGKIGSGVTHFDAGMFSGENGLEDGKIGGCQATAVRRLAGMSAQ
jgi:hypothetical protein